MRTKDHYIIGERIVKCLEQRVTTLQRTAFLAGCVEPDYNPFSYLKGSVQYQKLRGHNYENASGVIHKYMTQLTRKRDWSLYMYYKLGRLLHYAADAFTYPHNEQFEGSLQEHVEYEHELHRMLLHCQEIVSIGRKRAQVPEKDLYSEFRKVHDQYLIHRRDMRDDIHYILRICLELSSTMLMEAVEYDSVLEASVISC